MLKIITVRNESESAVTVYLCGHLTGEYLPELEKALSPDAAPNILLDMSNCYFVDRTSMEFLCGVKSRVVIQNILEYVKQWIMQEFRCGSSGKEYAAQEHSEK